MSGGTFSRGRWRKLKELLAAEKAADAKTLALRATAKKKLTAAIKVARTVTDVSVDDSKRISLAFDAAFGARSLAEIITQADIVLAHARTLATVQRKPKPPVVAAPYIEPEIPDPEPPQRRQLRARPDRPLTQLEAIAFEIEEMMEDQRIAALIRIRQNKVTKLRAERAYRLLEPQRAAQRAAERDRKRLAAERRDIISRACQAHMAEAINTLIDTLDKSAVGR